MTSQEPTYVIAPDGGIHTRTSCMFCGLSLCVCDVEGHIHEIHPEILHLSPTYLPAFNNTISDDGQILAVTSLKWNPSSGVEIGVSVRSKQPLDLTERGEYVN